MQKKKLNFEDLKVESFITEIEYKKLNYLRAGGGDPEPSQADGDCGNVGNTSGSTPQEEAPKLEEEPIGFWGWVKNIFKKKD